MTIPYVVAHTTFGSPPSRAISVYDPVPSPAVVPMPPAGDKLLAFVHEYSNNSNPFGTPYTPTFDSGTWTLVRYVRQDSAVGGGQTSVLWCFSTDYPSPPPASYTIASISEGAIINAAIYSVSMGDQLPRFTGWHPWNVVGAGIDATPSSPPRTLSYPSGYTESPWGGDRGIFLDSYMVECGGFPPPGAYRTVFDLPTPMTNDLISYDAVDVIQQTFQWALLVKPRNAFVASNPSPATSTTFSAQRQTVSGALVDTNLFASGTGVRIHAAFSAPPAGIAPGPASRRWRRTDQWAPDRSQWSPSP